MIDYVCLHCEATMTTENGKRQYHYPPTAEYDHCRVNGHPWAEAKFIAALSSLFESARSGLFRIARELV